jgi:uncharacterized membrane protein
MAKINKYLSEWEQEGLISKDVVSKILKYENSKHKKPWIMYGFIMLGVVVLSIGIISLVAANWSSIPTAVKLVIDILILGSVAFAIYKSFEKGRSVLFDALSSLFVFLYLASIGLVSQIYHTGGHVYEALFLLSVVSFPVALLSFKKFLPHIWTAIFLLAVIIFCGINLDRYDVSHLYFALIGILFSLPLICTILGNLFGFSKITDKMSAPFILWSIIFIFSGIFFYDFNHSISSYYHSNIFSYSNEVSIAPYYFIINISLLAAIVILYLKKNISGRVKVLITILACVYCIFMNIFMYSEAYIYEYYKLHDYSRDAVNWLFVLLKFSGPIETILSLFLFSLIFSSYNMKRFFNLMILLIAVRFLIIYFQVFKSLAYTGFGLIISGLLIIGIVVLWYKYSGKIEKIVRGLLK